ncbi:cupin domain-containing protein [Parvularcula sp. IMCC14364]|uniref:cupin domain-containing protein n=1 Tax=Parvularcula sp. IMCC14364 TaxID=3067902 RepID=UPI0027409725|nr:cupin domain-containing protein [Parvularcula sp. IMCC14364]
MPKIDIDAIDVRKTCAYPAPYASHCDGREKQALGNAGHLDQFGVNLTRLKPGAASAHKHWHAREDEFIYMLKGEAVLIEDDAETILRAGDAAAFKAGVENGHMLVNRSGQECLFIEVGSRMEDDITSYTDESVDMQAFKVDGDWEFRRKDGTPFEG